MIQLKGFWSAKKKSDGARNTAPAPRLSLATDPDRIPTLVLIYHEGWGLDKHPFPTTRYNVDRLARGSRQIFLCFRQRKTALMLPSTAAFLRHYFDPHGGRLVCEHQISR